VEILSKKKEEKKTAKKKNEEKKHSISLGLRLSCSDLCPVL